MAKTHKSSFVPKNPEKYMGTGTIFYRSSWELAVMRLFDSHPNVIGWNSEGISIPYCNPLTMRHTVYIPDFLVVYEKGGKKIVEMIEVKPAKEVPGFNAKRITKRDKLAQALNAAKWQAAASFCAKRGIKFRVITENELFPAKNKKG